MRRLVKIYGERHTGTRLLGRALRSQPRVELTASGAHYRVAEEMARAALAAIPLEVSRETRRVLHESITDDLTFADGPIGAWKHAAAIYDPAFAAKEVSVLATVKSPGAWLMSMYRKPYHRLSRPKRGPLFTFASAPWVCVRRDLTPPVVSSLVELWNLKVASYLEFEKAAKTAGVRCLIVRSEDLVLDQPATLARIYAWLGVEPGEPVREMTADTKHRGRTMDDLKRYYGDELWRAEIDGATSDFLTRSVDNNLISRFGYRL